MYAERQGSFAKQEENVKVIENLEKTIRELKTEISVINGKVTNKHQNNMEKFLKTFFGGKTTFMFLISLLICSKKRGALDFESRIK